MNILTISNQVYTVSSEGYNNILQKELKIEDRLVEKEGSPQIA